MLARVGLAEKIREKAGALSGGQQQRVSVARALYNGRPILVGDEPVSALDRVQGAAVLAEMARSHETLVLALHDVALALAHTDRIVVLEAGRIVLDAPARRPRRRGAEPVLPGGGVIGLQRTGPGYAAVQPAGSPAAALAALVPGRPPRHQPGSPGPISGASWPACSAPTCSRWKAWSVVYTIAFAVLGVTLGAGAGFLLAIPFARFRAASASSAPAFARCTNCSGRCS